MGGTCGRGRVAQKNITWHSKDINGFLPGETIYGTITKTSDATWVVDSAFMNHSTGTFVNTTLRSQVGDFVFNYADVTLEVYNVSSCDELAMGPVPFSHLSLSLTDGSKWVPPMWYTNGQPGCKGGVKVQNSTNILIEYTG